MDQTVEEEIKENGGTEIQYAFTPKAGTAIVFEHPIPTRVLQSQRASNMLREAISYLRDAKIQDERTRGLLRMAHHNGREA